MKAKEYLPGLLTGLLIIGLIVLYVLEFQWFSRTLGAGRLVIWSLVLGLAVGLVLGHLFLKNTRDLTERLQIYLFFTVICALFMPLFGSLSNRLLAFRAPQEVPVEFVAEEPRYASLYGVVEGERPKANQYFLFFYYEGRLYRVKYPEPRFPQAQRGDTVSLEMKKGLWGFEVVR